jgi:hypothetical protein
VIWSDRIRYDSNALRALIANQPAKAVIPSDRTRKRPIPHNDAAYKLRLFAITWRIAFVYIGDS